MALMTGRRLFTVWHWFAAPLLLGAFLIAFWSNVYLGLLWSLLFAFWFWDMGEATCSHCSSYGTTGCGIQGKIVPWFWKKKPMASASTWRIRWHFYFDILMFVVVNLIYCLEPVFLPLSLVWTIGAWLISFGPKKYHGLLFRLKAQPAPKSTRFSLPVVVVPDESSVVHSCDKSIT